MPDRLTPHFTLDEFECPCCTAVDPVTAAQMAELLEEIRPDTGPIIIVSSFRCQKHNEHVGGKADSFHLLGLAVDFFVTSDSHRYRALRSLLDHGWLRIGVAKDFLHVDRRPDNSPCIWTYYA
jgi:uncharacterized protein YcbK (DUF882 family)